MKQIISTKKAPAAIGPYSQAVDSGALVFTSGQLPVDPETGAMPEGIAAQTRRSIENALAVLEAAGLCAANVIKTSVFIKNMEDFAEMNKVYGECFPDPYPARTCVEVARLPKDALIEIECIAAR